MTEDMGLNAYTIDSEGNREEFDADFSHQSDSDDDDDAPPAPGFHPDGSRTWRFVPQADPRQWADLNWIDQNIEEVKKLGWIEDNPEGSFWTVEAGVQAYEQWAERATEAYRTVDFGDGTGETFPYVPTDQRPAPEPVDYGAIPAAPPAAAAPPAPAPAAPADPSVTHGDVMAELRRQVPENDGRWTATQAAGFDNDTRFFDEQGITAAQDRAGTAAQGAIAPDGTMTPEAFNAVNEAGADAARAQIHADTTRNRYQQSTDYQPPVSEAEQVQMLDESVQSMRQQAADDPRSLGLNMTIEQQQEYADAQEYAARTGQQLDPSVPLNAEQRAWLEQTRQAQ